MGSPGSCDLFVDLNLREQKLVEVVRQRTSGITNCDYVDCGWGKLDVERNSDYSFWKRRGEDGFLHYRYIVWIEPREDTSFPAHVAGIKQLIRDLRELGARTVAACNFEDDLRVDDAGGV